jgi:phosphoribosylglycinamide formyltransferase-1
LSDRRPVERLRVAVLVSGSGTNLQAILDDVRGRDGIEVVAVASNKPEARALERAREAGVETGVFDASAHGDRSARDRTMAAWLEERGAELVVLAGFMELLSKPFLETFAGRIINVHPSLLPAFPGPRPIEDQLDYGVKVGGVTVHFVDSGVDSGPVILQEAVRLPYTRDAEDVRARLHEVEHRLLPRAIRLIAHNAVGFDPENPRYVHVDESALQEGADHG